MRAKFYSRKWLVKKLMCGHCSYGCCNSPTFVVKSNADEIKLYKDKHNIDVLPIVKQDSKCKFLKDDDTGCSFSEDRPIFCKLFPLKVNEKGKLVSTNWMELHCPMSKHYELIKIENGKYHYKINDKSKHNNRDEIVILDKEIENAIDPIYISFKKSIVEAFGEEFYNKMKMEIEEDG